MPNSGFCRTGEPRNKNKKSEKIDKYEDLVRELKKTMERDGDTNCNWCTWNNSQWVSKATRRQK